MHLKELDISGFRGISKLHLDEFKTINIFVGKNNSGKTSVLEAIFLLVGISNPELIVRINNLRELFVMSREDLRFIYYNLDYNSRLTVSGKFDQNNYTRSLTVTPNKSKIASNQPVFGKITPNKPNELVKSFNSIDDESTINELQIRFTVKEDHKRLSEFAAKLTLGEAGVTIEPSKNYKETIKGIFLPSRWTSASNLEKRLENILVAKQQRQLVEVLSRIDPSIKDFQLINKIIYVDLGLPRLIPINLMGDGIRRLISILLSMYDAQDGIVLIDEIDNGLHFSAQKTLWRAIIEASKKYSVQIFLTTHNPEVLKYLTELVTDEVPDFKNQVQSITIRKTGQEIVAYKYDFDKLGFSIQQGIEFR